MPQNTNLFRFESFNSILFIVSIGLVHCTRHHRPIISFPHRPPQNRILLYRITRSGVISFFPLPAEPKSRSVYTETPCNVANATQPNYSLDQPHTFEQSTSQTFCSSALDYKLSRSYSNRIQRLNHHPLLSLIRDEHSTKLQHAL